MKVHVNEDRQLGCVGMRGVGRLGAGRLPPITIQDGDNLFATRREVWDGEAYIRMLHVTYSVAGRDYVGDLLPCDVHTHVGEERIAVR